MRKKENKDLNKLKPSEFMRMRRPEQYSDSLSIEEPQLTKDILEYHLETLTNRSQEKEFEHFSRNLLEKEICPNLRPQTGPTGGGDSKADTETYPVAEAIALRWYQGDASAKVRWAFAMSANRKWKEKAKKDVKGIVDTKRGYSLIYFVSNQFISDKKRAEAEDEFKKEFGVEVRILDRAWIVDRVIKNNHINIAATTLSIPGLQVKSSKRTGPLDAQREIDLKELDDKVKDPAQYAGVSYQLAEDCLRSALIASELARPRNEVDGRFAAALRIAETVNDERQILRIAYRQAWATCFAYDDVPQLSNLYDKIEDLALKSDNADDVECLFNLWNALLSSLRAGQITEEKAKLKERSKILIKKLEEISQQSARPNNAHGALTMLNIHNLTLHLSKESPRSELEKSLSALATVMRSSEGLGEYPFDSYAKIVFELGNIFTDSPAYEELFDAVNDQMIKRSGEGTAGIANLNRGVQKLRVEKIYDAIRLFGQAQQLLGKEEHRRDLIKSLIACGAAYQMADLPWASRANILAALSMLLSDFHSRGGRMPHIALSAAQKFTTIEITLGRVTPALFGFLLCDYIASHIELDEEDKEQYAQFKTNLDAVFAILLLKANDAQLKHMTNLPHLLEKQELFMSEGTVLFALGHLNVMREYKLFEQDKSDQYIEEFFENFPIQPANEDLPDGIELFLNPVIQLESNVLGTKVIINSERNSNSVLIAETLLSVVEAFFATSLASEVFPYREKVEITVKTSPSIKNPFGIEIITSDVSTPIEILHTENFGLDSKEAILNFRNLAHDFIAAIVPQIIVMKDVEKYLTHLAEEEQVFGRALTFSDVLTVSKNILGGLDWFELSKWPPPEGAKEFPLLREVAWKPKRKPMTDKNTASKEKQEEYVPPDQESLKHSDRKVVTIIDLPLWDKAKWGGMLFMGCPHDSFPPALGMIFGDKDAAQAIFEGWITRVGKEDENEEIRIGILTGIDRSDPAHYTVHVSSNVKSFEKDERILMGVSRFHRMTPSSTANLDRFLKSYNKFKVYGLIPGYMGSDGKPQMLDRLAIVKKEIFVRPAWQVGEHDEDLPALRDDVDPIIPPDVKDAPILAALKRFSDKDKPEE